MQIARYRSRKAATKTQLQAVYLVLISFKFPKIADYQRKLRINKDSGKNVSGNFSGNFLENFPKIFSGSL